MKKSKKTIILVSGKRWSGKDYLCDQAIAFLHSASLFQCIKISHSDILKAHYCQKTGTKLAKLLADRTYKEKHRNKMIDYAQQLQADNPAILSEWVVAKIRQSKFATATFIFVSDFRRKFEQLFFENAFGENNIVTVRVNAANETRKKRGWEYDPIKDTRYTECELDDKQDWNLIFHNDGTKDDVANWVQNYLANYLTTASFSKGNTGDFVNHEE